MLSVPPAAWTSALDTSTSRGLPGPSFGPAAHALHRPSATGPVPPPGSPGDGKALPGEPPAGADPPLLGRPETSGTGTPSGENSSCAPCCTGPGRLPVPAASAAL